MKIVCCYRKKHRAFFTQKCSKRLGPIQSPPPFYPKNSVLKLNLPYWQGLMFCSPSGAQSSYSGQKHLLSGFCSAEAKVSSSGVYRLAVIPSLAVSLRYLRRKKSHHASAYFECYEKKTLIISFPATIKISQLAHT